MMTGDTEGHEPAEARQGFFNSFRQHDAQIADPDADLEDALHQALEPYHSQLIALGSAIGTGLFIGSGQGLAVAGTIPLLLAFSFVGFTLCPTILALGEMATLIPKPGGFFHHTRVFVHEAWAAAMGWNYAVQWLITMPLELVAASITLQYWGNPLRHHDIWVTLFLILIVLLNIFGVKLFANAEVVLSLLKVIAIVGFIILGILIDIGLGFGGRAIGTKYWYEPGAFDNGWWGFCSVLITAAFAYSGSELVGTTAAEQRKPERDMPKAIKQFYICSIFIVGLLVPYTDPGLINDKSSLNSKGSPFVIAIKNAGIPALPSIFNTVILITVVSVANSSVYGSSRVLGAMAYAGMAPKRLTFVDQKGRPLWCFALALAFGLLAYLAELEAQETVFTWLLSLVGLSSSISWASICYTHLRFRKALRLKNDQGRLVHNRPPSSMPFRSPLGAWGSRIGLFCNCFIILIQFLTGIWPVGYKEMNAANRAQSFFLSFMAFILVAILFLGFRYAQNSRIVRLQDVDLSDTWHSGDWENYAAQHRNDCPPEELFWWVRPERLRNSLQWRIENYSDGEDEPEYIPEMELA